MNKKIIETEPAPGTSNVDKPKYQTESGEEIEYMTESLCDLVTLSFSRMKQFIDVIDMIDFNKGPNINIDSCQMFLAETGRTLIRDIESKFGVIYDTIEKEVGDIRVDMTINKQFGKDDDTPLGAYIETSRG